MSRTFKIKEDVYIFSRDAAMRGWEIIFKPHAGEDYRIFFYDRLIDILGILVSFSDEPIDEEIIE